MRGRSFYQYFICPLRHIAHQRELRSYELEMIKLFRPKLNHPHCNPILKKFRIHVQQYTLPSTTLGLLGNTAIQKYYDNFIPNDQCTLSLTVLHSRPADLYNILYQLGSNTRAKFDVAKILRSGQTSLALLYLLYRYCGQLDEPHRTQATTLVTKAIQFQGGHPPPANIPIQLHSLSIDHRDLHRQWLRDFLQQNSKLFPWFHLPTTQQLLSSKIRPGNHVFTTFTGFFVNGIRTPLHLANVEAQAFSKTNTFALQDTCSLHF